MLASAAGFTVKASALTPGKLQELLRRQREDVVVLGEAYARTPALVEELHRLSPGLGVVLIADEISLGTKLRLLSVGATACLPTDARESEVINAVRLASEGRSMHVVSERERLQLQAPAHFTAQERVVIGHLQRGLSNRAIADQLSISVNTVRSHVSHIYAKLGIKRRAELFARELPEFRQ